MTTNTADAKDIAKAIRSSIKLSETERLYAVIDACQAMELVELANSKYGQKPMMLFKGEAACMPEIESVAPYFISIDMNADFLEAWAEYWGKNAGILFTSAAEPSQVFRHLRNIFVVQDESGQEHFFRFYDPRVLRIFLPTCTEEEASDLLRSMKVIILESQSFDKLMFVNYIDKKLVTELRPTKDRVFN